MRKIVIITVLISSMILFMGCDNQPPSESEQLESVGFAMYLVSENSPNNGLSYGSMVDEQYVDGELVNLDDVIFESEPLITDKDIKEYHWGTHTIMLTDEYIEKRNLSTEEKLELEERSGYSIIGGSILLNTNMVNMNMSNRAAAIVTIGGSRIYASGFPLSILSSVSPAEIIIQDADPHSLIITSRRTQDDQRQDKRIYDFLKSRASLNNE
jgi:hypothetical protein